MTTPDDDHALDPPEPRWQAIVAALAAGGLYAAMPPSLSIGPTWLAPLIVALLAGAIIITHRSDQPALNHLIGYANSSVITLFLVWSLVLLVRALPAHKETPVALMRSAVLLWISNILVFALWYWRMDAGGPNRRDLRLGHPTGAFLFPPMTQDGARAAGCELGRWSPDFLDYLFLSFNTSTAFSPTDTLVLARWAKVLTMAQSSISLAIVVILAARAVNIL
jgi:hypothetical protein